jgi:GTP-binding protein LepA
MTSPISRIRNFSIVAHIDHGKTTLSDRLLEMTGTMQKREMTEQTLDGMELEKERGITIKAKAVTLHFRSPKHGKDYILNLIDTPGHVDFGYEVSRALAACEGAILVVDASQGVEAQTLANAYLATGNNLEIIPVINKIDLPSAQPDMCKEQIEQIIGLPADDAILASAKNGTGVMEILEAIVDKVPHPAGDPEAPLKALIFDSWYDTYQGVILLVRLIDGHLRPGQKVRFLYNGRTHNVDKCGVFSPKMRQQHQLAAGEVGWFTANIKNVHDTKIGDTVTEDSRPCATAYPGFKEVKPMVFAGFFPMNAEDYPRLKDALGKLTLNDSSFSFQPETSDALGFGYRCGFLGLLHMEIIQERLEREFNLELITTAPSVTYRVTLLNKPPLEISNPSQLPPLAGQDIIEEPILDCTIITQSEFLGPLLKLLDERRGVQTKFEYISSTTVMLHYDLPLGEIVLDFYDKLKTLSRGYASLDYTFKEWREADLKKLDILVNGKPVDALSTIIHEAKAFERGKALVSKMRELIPRQMFEVVLQATIGSKIVAREEVKALRKNVLAKCYGGDISRKRKLLEKQKEGKKRMKSVGSVDIPQEAFLALLKLED